MPRLNQAKILAADDYPLTEVEVPEWGGSIHLKAHSLRDTIAVEEDKAAFHEDLYLAVYLARSIVDDQGKRLFATPEAIEGLAGRHPEVLLRLFYRALELNKGEDAKAREKHEGAAPQAGVPAGGAAEQDGR